MDSLNSNLSDNDEFEFKPLTDGLGFHQKKQTPAKPIANFKNVALKSVTAESEINPPRPRQTKSPTHVEKSVPSVSRDQPRTNTVDEILKALNDKKNLDFTSSKENYRKPVQITFKPAAWDLSASLLDAMLVTAATLFCLILLLVITQIDLIANIYHPDAGGLVYWSLLALIGSIAWIYLVCNRVFLGFTPGEWVFDQRLGKPEENATATYAMKTVLRSSLVILTGFFVFPLISFAMNDDLLGKLVGLRLMKKA